MQANDREQIEIDYWRNSSTESPEANSVHNIVNKMTEARGFLEVLDRFSDDFARAGRVLELGGGQGWASCFLKERFPSTFVVASDISPWAIQSLPKWKRLLGVTLDGSFASRSNDIDAADGSFDCIFAFAAAHHFSDHTGTLAEINRVLSPGGTALYLFEPAAPKLLYRPAVWRVNRKRPECPEDVLVISELRHAAELEGMAVEVDYYPSLTNRGTVEGLYYFVLGRVPFLTKVLPCTVNMTFTKPITLS